MLYEMKRLIHWQRYSGIATVLILWVSILTALHEAGLSLFGQKPLSYLGTVAESAPYFSIGLILAALTLLAFGHYLSHIYSVSRSFVIALYIGQAGQIVAALVPFGGAQPAKIIHTYAAFTLAGSIPVLLWRFAAAQKQGPFRTLVYRLMWLEITAFIIGIGTFVLIRKGAPIGQTLPAVAFHIWIFFVSFDSFRSKHLQSRS